MTHRDSVPGFLFVVVTCLTINSSRASGWMPNGNGLAVMARNQGSVVATTDGVGGAIVAWQDSRNSSGVSHSFDIYAQRIDSNGNALWAENGVPVCTLSGSDSRPQVVPDGVGGAIIVWSRTSVGDIFVQRLDASGNPIWQANGIPVIATLGMQISPQVVVDGTGGAIVTWYEAGDLFAQRILATGSLAWAANGVSVVSKPGRQQFQATASDGTGGAIIAWEDTSSAVTNFDIYAQRIASNGTRSWAAAGEPVCTLPNRQRETRIIPDPSGGAVIFWRDETTWPGTDLYMQRVNSSGASLWTQDGVALCTASGFKNLSALRRAGNGLYAAWSDYRSGNGDVYAQRIDWSGNSLWDANGLAVTNVAGDQSASRMSIDSDDNIIIAWTDYTSSAYDIFAQRVDPNGQFMWSAQGVVVCDAPGSQSPGGMVSDDNGGAILTWSDSRNGVDPDVYAQHLGPQGPTLTGVDRTPSAHGLSILSNRPNPFGESSVLEVELDARSDVAVELFDVGGHRVREDRWPAREAGPNRFDIRARDQDGRILPSGVYFLRVTAGASTATHKIVITR